MLLRYCISDFEVVPVAPVITGITFAFTFHMRWISTVAVAVVVVSSSSSSSCSSSSSIIISSSSRTDTIINALGYNSIQNFSSTHTSDYIFSQSVRMLILIRTTTYSFSTLERWWKLYLTLVRPKHEYALFVWNSMPSTDAKKLTRIQRKFIALYHFPFYTYDHVTYKNFLKFLKLHTLHSGRLFWSTISCSLVFRFKTLPVYFGYYW